ncbi:MAG: OmpP1/FadL family transporter [Hyphomicrobium sp.]
MAIGLIQRYALGGTAVALALGAGIASAEAGGFAPHEQSTYFLGTAFAGTAAGGALSSMFWNPAAAGQFDGFNGSSNYSLIMPDTEITATGGALYGTGSSRSSGDIGDTALLPASYYSLQVNDQLVLGLGANVAFGLTTDSNFSWDGAQLARESRIVTYNFTPTAAYRLAPGVIIGAGVQIQYIDAQLRQAVGSPYGPTSAVKGDDVAFGFTAGILLTPADGTSIGLGFRSGLDHNLDGTFHISGLPGVDNVSAGLDLPEVVTLSLRQDLTPSWTLLGSVEWTNWSRLSQLEVFCDGAGTYCPASGVPLQPALPLNWEDGWMFSAGLEHKYNEQLTLRGGLAWEKSPIQSAEGRTVRVPDSDRFWLSAGASYEYNQWMTIDVAYAHLWGQDATTVQGVGLGPGGSTLLVGEVESSADIVSVGLRTKLDWLLNSNWMH